MTNHLEPSITPSKMAFKASRRPPSFSLDIFLSHPLILLSLRSFLNVLLRCLSSTPPISPVLSCFCLCASYCCRFRLFCFARVCRGRLQARFHRRTDNQRMHEQQWGPRAERSQFSLAVRIGRSKGTRYHQESHSACQWRPNGLVGRSDTTQRPHGAV